jgi:hypothetical protein
MLPVFIVFICFTMDVEISHNERNESLNIRKVNPVDTYAAETYCPF